MSDELHKKVIIEGDSSGAKRALDDVSKSTDKVRESSKKAAKAEKEFGDAQEKVAKQSSLYAKSMNLGVKATDKMLKGLKPVAAQMPILTRGINGVNAAFKLLAAHPILAVLGMLAGLFTKITEKIKGSEEMTDRLAMAMATFQPIIKGVNTVLEGLGKMLVSAIEGMSKLAETVLSIIPSYKKAIEEAKKFAKMEDDLDDQRRENQVKQAAEEQRISELRIKLRQKDMYSLEERKKFTEEYTKLLDQQSERELQIAKQELELAKYKAAQDVNSQADNDRLAAAEAKVHDVETRINMKRRELTNTTNLLTAENDKLNVSMGKSSGQSKAELEERKAELEGQRTEVENLTQTWEEYQKAVKMTQTVQNRESWEEYNKKAEQYRQTLVGVYETLGLLWTGDMDPSKVIENNINPALQETNDLLHTANDEEEERLKKLREQAKERAKEAKEVAAIVADEVRREFKSIDGLYEKALADLKALKEEEEDSDRIGDQDKYREKMYKDGLSKQKQAEYDLKKQYAEDLILFRDDEEMKAKIKAKYIEDLAELQKKFDDEEKERQQKLLSAKETAVGDLTNAYGNLFSTLVEMSEEMMANDEANAKKQFELQKALKIGQAIMSLATGSLDIASNFPTLTAKYTEAFTAYAGPALAVAQTVAESTALAASFATQMAAIKNTKFGSTSTGAGARAVTASTPVASYQAPNSYSETQVANPQDSRVYILASDIHDSQRLVENRQTDSRY